MADLLPCPFCGSAAKISGGNLRWWVSCTRLGVCIANRPDVAAYSCENKADATRLWNTRHDHTADLVEALTAARAALQNLKLYAAMRANQSMPEVKAIELAAETLGIIDTALSRARNTPDLVGEK